LRNVLVLANSEVVDAVNVTPEEVLREGIRIEDGEWGLDILTSVRIALEAWLSLLVESEGSSQAKGKD
jgi:hypothetical protein